ncbi:hypothetical protein [Pseudarthrobacter sp. BIM B-2242]|uniref:hypothetical protein n=1 Tax=Pseudarthrobacter sp. BIM B-2242 TaxID=2772401 RepID=UPI00168A540F|nr:hypothetical protein [Pseudarthrobacter sp. BIM B-2242]QOD05736.1 hypothetical protein IDT60_22115 [Pseudarthrobacter sp. BIM B-2242]
MQGENSKRMHEAARERDDINYQRSQESAYQSQNWQHKKLTFEAEQRTAHREGRPPLYASPVEVPDMPRTDEGLEPAPKSTEGLHPAFVVAAVIFIVFVFVLPALGPVIEVAVRIIVLTLLAGLAGLTVTWLILRSLAKDDPAKVHRAKLFNPVRVSKILALTVYDLVRARFGSKKNSRE